MQSQCKLGAGRVGSLGLQHACRGLLFSCWSVKWKAEQCNLSLHKLNTILNCSEVVHCYQFNSPCLVSSSAFCGLHSLPGYVSLYKPQQKLLKLWCLGSCAYPAKSNQKHIYKYRYKEENTIYIYICLKNNNRLSTACRGVRLKSVTHLCWKHQEPFQGTRAPWWKLA